MTPETAAAEARRLLEDRVLRLAIQGIRMEAVEDLVAADASQVLMVLRAQERIKLCDEIFVMLERFIQAVPADD